VIYDQQPIATIGTDGSDDSDAAPKE
jgi:hypothetical protein